jgi:hypothetical protein
MRGNNIIRAPRQSAATFEHVLGEPNTVLSCNNTAKALCLGRDDSSFTLSLTGTRARGIVKCCDEFPSQTLPASIGLTFRNPNLYPSAL